MLEFISISERSSKLIAQLSQISQDPLVQTWHSQAIRKIERKELVAWLARPVSYNNKTQLPLERVHTALLEDLYHSLMGSSTRSEINEKKSLGWFGYIKFQLMVLAGSLLALCAGFSGIIAILNTFAIPTALVVGAGIIFATISFAFFYNFDRVDMSKIFGTKLKQSYRLLDVCVNQVEQIKNIRKKIDDCYATVVDLGELQALYEMVKMLSIRYEALNDVRDAYHLKLKNPYLKTVKVVMAILDGIFILASGFFSGQSLALTVACFFATPVSVAFWPIPVAGLVLGLAALGVYCVVDRPGYENRVGHLLGFDEKEIEVFAGNDRVIQQTNKLQCLENKVLGKIHSQRHLEHLNQTIKEFTSTNQMMNTELHDNDAPVQVAQNESTISLRPFFRRAYSMSDLRLDRVSPVVNFGSVALS